MTRFGFTPTSLRDSFFALPDGAPRDRRPTDISMLVFTSVLVLVFAMRTNDGVGALESAITATLRALPGIFDPIWSILHDLLRLWAVVLIVVSLWRRRWGLLRDLALGWAVATGLAAVVGRVTNHRWPDVVDGLLRSDVVLDYPVVGLAVSVTVASIASTHLSRPYRYLSRWIIGLGCTSAAVLGITTVPGAIGAAALGIAIASGVHLVFGSPGGLPSTRQVDAMISDIGLSATTRALSRRVGVVVATADDHTGRPLDVKIYGRDAWDGQLLVSLWRFVWYREGGPTLALTRLQQVEHEAFLTLLAASRGASVHPVVSAGKTELGDALLVVERVGTPAISAPSDDPAASTRAMWESLAALHSAGITHGSIDAERVFVDGDRVLLADLAAGEVLPASDAAPFLRDRAQMFCLSAAIVGTDVAIAGALSALGSEGLADVMSYVQPAAMSSRLRRDLARADVDIDELRKAAVAAIGGEERELQRLRRLTVGRVLMVVLLFIAGSTLIGGLLEIGFDTLFDAVRDASLPVVVAAFFISLLSRPINAWGVTALSPVPIPLGRVTVLMFAMNFVNLAMPSTAGRVAVNIRFFQRSGVDPTVAVAIGALDGVTSFLCQLLLIGLVLISGLGTLDMDLSNQFSVDSFVRIVALLGILVVIGVVVVFAVPKLRNLALSSLRSAWGFVTELLRRPIRLVKAMASNMGAELVYSTVLFTVLVAYGQSVNFVDIVFVGIAVSLFAGLMPVPGGIGVAEAGLTAGFMAAGVDQTTAFAAALTVRLCTFYLPPFIGWFALRWLQRRKFL